MASALTLSPIANGRLHLVAYRALYIKMPPREGDNLFPFQRRYVDALFNYIMGLFRAYIIGLDREQQKILLKAIAKRAQAMRHSEFPEREFERLVQDLQRSPEIAPPTEAPALFKRRIGIKPSDFLQEHYGRYIRAGALYQRHIAKLDPGLLSALGAEFRGRRHELREFLPTIEMESQAIVERCANPPAKKSAGRRLATALRHR